MLFILMIMVTANREMYFSVTMVIDQDKSDYSSTDVSGYCFALTHYVSL